MSNQNRHSEACIFCRILEGKEEGTFIYRGNKVSAILDIHPLFEGHTLIIPNEHFVDITDVDEDVLSEVIKVAKIVSDMMIKNLHAEGVNVMHSTGRPAGQTIFHFHVHVLPRRTGDDTEFEKWWFARSHKASREELDSLAGRMLL
ncbi:MAG: HIT domain-containing protein [Candidatus Thermoplasmatota archaeon]|nr:HIT domain-containing protein [Candidatus Thermoplasmatota archaeon]MCL5874120.1 HIT domain-containing protein [Candidatus Thermoplasmatota archaeon]